MKQASTLRSIAIAPLLMVWLQTAGIGEIRPVSEYFDTIEALTRLPDDTLFVVGAVTLPMQGELHQSEANVLEIAPDGVPTVTTLGSLPGGAFKRDQARDISPNGEFIAGHSVSQNSTSEAALWRMGAPDTPIPLGFLPQSLPVFGDFSEANAVSNDGDVVGISFPSAFLWNLETSGPMQELPSKTPDSTPLVFVNDISADGSVIVGASQDETSGSLEATTFTVDAVTFLSNTSQSDSRALAVSPNGASIVGYSNEPNTPSGPDSPTIWHPDGTRQLLQNTLGPIVGRATSVADNGFVVGSIANGTGVEDDRPFIWRDDFENGHARDFSEWLLNDHELPLTDLLVREIHDVHWNGSWLDFAVTIEPGGPHVISVPIAVVIQGDFNNDLLLDTQDIDLLCDEIASSGDDPLFDLDGDDILGVGDVVAFLALVDSLPGDVDLNGTVGFSDFLLVSDNFTKMELHWSDGDLNCDGIVGFPDFLLVSANFGKTSSDLKAQAVPEPSGLSLMVMLMGCVVALSREF